MVIVDIDGKCLSSSVVTDASRYYYHVKVVLQFFVNPANCLRLDGKVLHILSTARSGLSYEYLCMSDKQYAAWSRMSRPVNMTGDCVALIRELGFDHDIAYRSKAQSHCLPAMSLEGVLDYLSQHIQFDNGGAPVFFLDFNGRVRALDYYYEYNSFSGDPFKVPSDILSDVCDSSWINHIPSSVRILQSDKDGIRVKDEVLFKDFGTQAKLYSTDFMGLKHDALLQEYHNDYYTAFFRSRSITFDDITGKVRLGMVVECRSFVGVVDSVSVTNQSGAGGAVPIRCHMSAPLF